jgi:hypothetical protein
MTNEMKCAKAGRDGGDASGEQKKAPREAGLIRTED